MVTTALAGAWIISAFGTPVIRTGANLLSAVRAPRTYTLLLAAVLARRWRRGADTRIFSTRRTVGTADTVFPLTPGTFVIAGTFRFFISACRAAITFALFFMTSRTLADTYRLIAFLTADTVFLLAPRTAYAGI